jgi:molybdate transport system ATP-binding protein
MSSSRRNRSHRFLQIDLQRIRLTLDGRAVLRGIDWRIEPGQRWVLLGANGAGKTQLLKLIAGDVWPTPPRGGTRQYRYGSEVLVDPHDIKHEIAYVGAERQDRYEHYRWNPTVEAVIGTGIYRTDIPLDPLLEADRTVIAQWLQRLDIQALATRRFLTLSYGERRLVLLARALAWRPKLLLLDELFNGLDSDNHTRAGRCLSALSRSALPWVLSTHREEDVPDQATHLCRLERGKIMELRPLLRRRRSHRHAAPPPPPPSRPLSPPPGSNAEQAPAMLQLGDASVWRDGHCVLRDVSLTIRHGDCWVVHGSNGSGKSSLLQLMYGDLGAAHGGRVWREGIVSGVPLEVFKRRIGLVAPELQAAHPRYLSVAEVVSSGLHSSIGMDPVKSLARADRIGNVLRQAGAESLSHRLVNSLSYGQLRRVLFARALIHKPQMLLLDEPYSGIDATTRRSLRGLVQRLLKSGVTVVMATHHRDDWPVTTCHELELDRSQVIYCGRARA